MQNKQATKGAYAIIDGVRVEAYGKNETEALNNLRAKIKQLMSKGAQR